MKYTLRAKIKNEIITEFVLPAKKSNKVIILCSGMPGYPSKKSLMFFLAEQGYWVFSFRYRGTWESGGKFLKKSPHLDVIDIMDALSAGFIDIWNNKNYTIKNPKVYVIGSSFGGPAAILASTDKRVRKVVAFSPVIDWRVDSKVEPMDKLGNFVKNAFGMGYRFSLKDWNKLKKGTFYNLISQLKRLNKDKLYIIYTKDDEIVIPIPTTNFCKELGCKSTLLKTGGHLSLSNLAKNSFWRRIKPFLK